MRKHLAYWYPARPHCSLPDMNVRKAKLEPGQYREDCMVCGADQPPGHVVVNSPDHKRREGRICSSHTFWEVISHSSDRFMVEITADPGPHHFTDALESVHRKHGKLVP